MVELKPIKGGKSRERAFEAFIVRHFDSLYRRAYRLTRDSDDADDLVQELCIRAHREFDELANMENPKAWLQKVLYRLFVDLARRNVSSRLSPLSEVQEDGSSLDVASSEPGPAEQAEADFLRARLQRALKMLRAEEQVLLVLHEVEGYSLTEIEELMGLPPTTVKSRLQRARVKLGRLMQTHCELTRKARGSSYELPGHHQSVG